VLVLAHYDIFKRGILHRDINVNNLMVKKTDLTHGILVDFDFACQVDAQGNAINDQYGGLFTFCLPFLALPRLSSAPPPHVYRHDLESFLWCLIWISTYYEDGARNSLDNLYKWYTERWEDVLEIKKILIRNKRVFPTATFGGSGMSNSPAHTGVFDPSDPLIYYIASDSPFKNCLKRLLKHLKAGYAAEKRSETQRARGEVTDYDEMTAGGHIIFSKFTVEIDVLLNDLQQMGV
jgi:hypothetical protein